jgi:predicted nucleic acid-binding protein
MILVDASVWIDHIRAPNEFLEGLLERGDVLTHAAIIGEIALGHIRKRRDVLVELRKIPKSETANDEEVFEFIERYRLYGIGIGYIDAHILASAFLTPGARLWTRDKRLRATAGKLNIAATNLH